MKNYGLFLLDLTLDYVVVANDLSIWIPLRLTKSQGDRFLLWILFAASATSSVGSP